MGEKSLAHRGRPPTSLARFLIRATLQYRIGTIRYRWPRNCKTLRFLAITLGSAPSPLFLSPRWIPRGRTSTRLQLELRRKALLARPVTHRFVTLLHQLTSQRVDRKEGSGREDAIVKRTPQIGTYERARKTGTASGLVCGSNLLTARQTPQRPRTFADTRHRSRTPDNMSKVDISNYGKHTDFCGFFFFFLLTQHSWFFFSYRPYICPECGRTWRDQGARYNHRVREHGYVPKKPKKWLDDDAALEGGTSSDNSHLNVSFVMESVGN